MAGYMIVDNNARDKIRRKKRRKTAWVMVVLCVVALLVCFRCYWASMMTRFAELACDNVEATVTLTVHKTIADVFVDAKYSDLVTVSTDTSGEIVAVEANQSAINLFALQTSAAVQHLIADKTVYAVPLGTVSGFTLLSESGPEVQATFRQIGLVKCRLESEFTSAGINQTLHRLYAVVTTSVEIAVPTACRTVVVETPVLVCETVIVGKVPQVYLGK